MNDIFGIFIHVDKQVFVSFPLLSHSLQSSVQTLKMRRKETNERPLALIYIHEKLKIFDKTVFNIQFTNKVFAMMSLCPKLF